MFIGSVFFAAMGLFTESLADEYSFTWIAAIRSAIATCLAAMLVVYHGAKFAFFRPASLWMRSLAGCAAMLCIFFAMTHFDVAVVLSLSSMYPIWVALLGWPLLGLWPTRDTWIALAISTVGMWLIYASATSGKSDLQTHAHYLPHLAIPLAALASMLSAIALIGLHRVKELDPRAVVTHFSAVSTAISFAAWGLLPQSQIFAPRVNDSQWRLLAVGVTAMLGQLFLTKAFSAGRPARISVIGLSQVAVAAGYKWVAEGHIPAPLGCIGMFMVLGSTMWVMINGRKEEPS
jgi:drug/metabolite transporter (DMT)-like permease